MRIPRTLAAAALLISAASSLPAQTAPSQTGPHRPPAVPLVAHHPYFSVWSMSDTLNGSNTRHWTGSPQPMTSLIRIDGKTFRLMGDGHGEALPQTSLQVEATHTEYSFAGAGVDVKLRFFTPAFPQDLSLLSRPVTYLTWTVRATDGKSHSVQVLYAVNPIVAVDNDTEHVTWGRTQTGSLAVLNVGSRDQRILDRRGDNLRADWGYFHLAVPVTEHARTSLSEDAAEQFAKDGTLPADDSMEMPATPRDGAAHLAAQLDLGLVGATAASQHVLVSYTESYAIEYLHQQLRPYWQRDNEPVAQMLNEAEAQYALLETRGETYDRDLHHALVSAGGEDYAYLATLSYRQALAACQLTSDIDGTPLLFAKENFSNGDISTVDIIYPDAPIFLFFNPALLEAQMEPVLRYASLPRWKFPFAPHDVGRWPIANGQEYGGGERTEDDQMPVEESGNLLILADALAHTQGDAHVAKKYWPLFTRWAEYLRTEGMNPANQLSTDDFAGHLAHNANLSLKAIDALGAYADLAGQLGQQYTAKQYRALAESMAKQWLPMAADGDHTKLAFDKPGTWSEKYNLVWDKLLNLNLFPDSLRTSESAFYMQHMNQYGVPLDNRATYTKLDWQVWSATMANPQQFSQWMHTLVHWTDNAPDRVPLTDWYDTISGKQIGFQARSVVGGVYIKAFSDAALAQQWRGMAKSR